MTPTEELCSLLDEAGVEYGTNGQDTQWWTKDNPAGVVAENASYPYGTLNVRGLTTEQAIAATVGRGTCHMETADGCQNWNSCSECGADYYTDQPINYCPNCGRKVVDE